MIQVTGDRRTQAQIDEVVRRSEQRQINERTRRFARSLDYHASIMGKVEELVECFDNGLQPDDLQPVLIVSWMREVLKKIEGTT